MLRRTTGILLILFGVSGVVTGLSMIGGHPPAVTLFVYILSGLIAGWAAMAVTVRAFADLGARWAASDGFGYFAAAGWLLGFFFVTPTVLGAAFTLLAAVLPPI